MSVPHSSPLNPEELPRYARHLSIPEFGRAGQERLKGASVLCIGAGGLGSPAAMYLAAAGIGRLGLVDADVVETSNLQRQILHGTRNIGQKKLDSALERLRDINPHVELRAYDARFTRENALELVSAYDVVLDGTDNFPTRYLSNDACVFLKKPNIYGSILRFEGQCSVFAPHLGGPCYRCMAPEPPKPGLVPSCAEGGVLGVMPGLVGTLQATEAIKLITGIGEPLTGRLLHVDALSMKFRTFRLKRDLECAVCGDNPTITELIDYEGFCGMKTGTESYVPEVTVQELNDTLATTRPVQVVDVREPEEFAEAAISGTVLIPLGELPDRLAEIARDRQVLVHCRSGVRSARAVSLLQKEGFRDVHNVAGGILAWMDAGYPVETGRQGE